MPSCWPRQHGAPTARTCPADGGPNAPYGRAPPVCPGHCWGAARTTPCLSSSTFSTSYPPTALFIHPCPLSFVSNSPPPTTLLLLQSVATPSSSSDAHPFSCSNSFLQSANPHLPTPPTLVEGHPRPCNPTATCSFPHYVSYL